MNGISTGRESSHSTLFLSFPLCCYFSVSLSLLALPSHFLSPFDKHFLLGIDEDFSIRRLLFSGSLDIYRPSALIVSLIWLPPYGHRSSRWWYPVVTFLLCYLLGLVGWKVQIRQRMVLWGIIPAKTFLTGGPFMVTVRLCFYYTLGSRDWRMEFQSIMWQTGMQSTSTFAIPSLPILTKNLK